EQPMLLRRPGADRVQYAQTRPLLARVPQRFAVNGNVLEAHPIPDLLDPTHKAVLKGARIQLIEDTPEGVRRGDAMRQLQEPPEPRCALLGKQDNVTPAIAIGYDPADSEHQDVHQQMIRASFDTRIHHLAKGFLDRAHAGSGHTTLLVPGINSVL